MYNLESAHTVQWEMTQDSEKWYSAYGYTMYTYMYTLYMYMYLSGTFICMHVHVHVLYPPKNQKYL